MTNKSNTIQHSGYDLLSPAQCLALFTKEHLGIDIDPMPDGKYHRYPAPGKSATNTACWIRYDEGGKYARCGNYITGESFTWLADAQTDSPAFEPEAMVSWQNFHQNQEERVLIQTSGATTAKAMLKGASQATSRNCYISQKRISPEGLFTQGVELWIPMVNIKGEIRNLQRIFPDGSKYFLKGGQVKGLFALCGPLFSSGKLYVCEGYATAATVHEESGHTAVAAMNAGNLLDVCLALARAIPPGIELIVAADNDHRTHSNPGVAFGKAAAQAIGASVVIPPLPCGYGDCRCTDFNDWVNCASKLMVAAHG